MPLKPLGQPTWRFFSFSEPRLFTDLHPMTYAKKSWFLAALCAANLYTTPSAQAGLLDFLPGFGNSNAIKTDNTQRKLWQISDFNSVQVVSREAGTPENSHPISLSTETLQ